MTQHEQSVWSMEEVGRKIFGFALNFLLAVILLLSLILVDKAHKQVRASTIEFRT